MTLKRRYDLTVSLLTPMHIGSGKELLRDYDYVTHGGKTWVMNTDAFLEYLQKPDGTFDERLIGRPPAELLTTEDYDLQNAHKIFRYVLPGQPRAQGYGAVLREQYKDVQDRPYIPGSSLKGALRTVLAWHGYQAQQLTLDVGAIQSGRSWAGQGLERKIFGRDPNHDLLRALQVADSQPQQSGALQIVNAQVVTGSDKFGSPIEIEAVKSDTVFQTTITVDEFLHSQAAEARLQFDAKWNWLEELPQIARRWATDHLAKELDWFKTRKYHNVGKLYHEVLGLLKRDKLPANSFFIQIGWGGGWTGKTIGYPLQQESKAWERLLGDKRLSPARIRRKEGDPFPKSRRVVVANQQVAAPLGWCLVEMKERK
jgi:CRISPR-associated protein Csm5